MEIDIKFSDIRLGIYQYIDNITDLSGNTFSLSLFLGFDSSLQAIIFNSDIKIIRDFIAKSVGKPLVEIERNDNFEFINAKSSKSVSELLEQNSTIEANSLKEKYFSLIYKYIYQKSDKILQDMNEDTVVGLEDESGWGLSRKEEFNLVKDIAIENFDNDSTPTELNDSLAFKFNLSPLESACIKYLSDSEYNEFPILNIFSNSGIIQIANKAAIKSYLNSRNKKL